MSRMLRNKVHVIPQEHLRRMEIAASIAMLELSTGFRRHVNMTLRDMFVLMSAPRHGDDAWRARLHDLARDLQSVGGSFDYLAGRVRRAPKAMRAHGFEWLFRLLRQPWRLPRMLRAAPFFILVMRQRRVVSK